MADYQLVNHVMGAVVTGPEILHEITEGVGLIHAKDLWTEGNYGEGVVVAVFDTGVFAQHTDLQGRIIDGRNFTDDYNSDPTNYADAHFHGTHVCGTIAANLDNNGVVGVAPKAQILMLKVLSNAGSGNWDWLIQAIDYAIAWRGPNGEKARIFSMSIGGPIAPAELHDAIMRADAAGCVILCAAGNDGDSNPDTVEISFPAYYPEVVCVGSFNGWGGISGFSDSNDQVDLIALGQSVLSTYIDGNWITASGTSMATPHASGALALLLVKLQATMDREVTGKELYNFLVNDYTHFIPSFAKTLQGNGLLMLGSQNVISPDEINFDDVLLWFTSSRPRPVLNSYDYWKANAIAGKTTQGDYVQGFMKKTYIVHGLNMTVKD